MPQMSPMWWDILFITFMLLYINMMIILFFNFNKKIKSESKSKMSKFMHWKW